LSCLSGRKLGANNYTALRDAQILPREPADKQHITRRSPYAENYSGHFAEKPASRPYEHCEKRIKSSNLRHVAAIMATT
jgi:hypothetical protein